MKRLTALSCAYSLLVLCLLLARVHGAQSWSDWAKSAFVAHAKAPVDALEEYMTVKDNDDEAWKFSHGAITVSQDDGTSAHLEVLRYHDPLEDAPVGPIDANDTVGQVEKETHSEFEFVVKKEKIIAANDRKRRMMEASDKTLSRQTHAFALNGTFRQHWMPFLLTTSKSCSENLKILKEPIHWSKSEEAGFDAELAGYVHDEFRQVLYDNWIQKFEILYTFESGKKTIEQRFNDATTKGEKVVWEVRFGNTVKVFKGTWWYSKGASVTTKMDEGAEKENFLSSDDGSFGAADGDVDGHDRGKCLSSKSERYGLENCNAKDPFQCGIYYMGKHRIISDHLRNVMYAGISQAASASALQIADKGALKGRDLRGRRLASSYCNFYRLGTQSGTVEGGTGVWVYGSNFNTGRSDYRCRFRDNSGNVAWSAYVRPHNANQIHCTSPIWSWAATHNTITVTLWESGTECSHVDARSCMHMRNSAHHLRDGNYQLANGKIVYCDMDNDGGGWMMAVQIDGNDQDHSNTGHVGASIVTPSVSYTSKYSDAEIRNYIGTNIIGSQASIKFICAGRHHYYRNCHFSATQGAGGNWASCVTNYYNYLANSVRSAQSCNCGSQALGSHCNQWWGSSMTYCSHCERGQCCCVHSRKGCGHDQYGYNQRGSVWVRGGSQGSHYSNTFTYSAHYTSLSRNTGYADGAHSVTVYGRGFNTGWSDYRCRWYAPNGHSVYSSYVRPSSSTQITCRSPSWSYTATGNTLTVYLYEQKSNAVSFTGNSRSWTYQPTYNRLSTSSGYADGAHSVTAYGYGFDTGRTDYRCRFRDKAGHQVYSANVRPSSATQIVCRSPSWSYTARDNPTTLYLMERSNNDVVWRGSARSFTYSATYHSLSRTSGYADGTHSVTITGYGFDTGRSDYRCRFRDGSGRTQYSANVKPANANSLTCRSPVWDYTATSNPATLYLMERSNSDVTWRGSTRSWTYSPTYNSISRTNGYADGAHSVTVNGHGFDTGRSDYRCRFRDDSGRQTYSSYARPSSGTAVTCRSPVWHYQATSNPTTIYLMERANNDVTWRGSARRWDYIVTYASVSRSSGYADGAHSVTVHGNGFNTGWSNYRCKFQDSAGNVVYSANSRPSKVTEVTCRSPVWGYTATSNPTTLFLLEQEKNTITWRGSARTWTYIVTYKSISRSTGYADGTHSVTITGNGFDKTRSDYRCRFRDGSGRTHYSANTRPSSATSLVCRSPVWTHPATSNPTTLYLMERSNNDVTWRGSARGWTFIVTYKSISLTTGYADGTHSVTVHGNGFNTGWSDYRCRFQDKAGNNAYSANVRASSDTYLTCRSPIWNFKATSNPTTLYLMERSSNDITWRGSARTWVFQITYKSSATSTKTGNTHGGKNVVLTGNGFDTSRSDYTCVFRNAKGYQRVSAPVRPDSPTQLTCTTPSYGDNLRLTEVILQESGQVVLYRGADTWERVFFFARPFYLGWHTTKNKEIGVYYDDVKKQNVLLESLFSGSAVPWASLSISAQFNGIIFMLAKSPNRIVMYDTSTNAVQFVSPTLRLNSPSTTSVSLSVIECDSTTGYLYGLVSYSKSIYMARIDPITGSMTNIRNLGINGVSHGVSSAYRDIMVFVQRPSNKLTQVNMENGLVISSPTLPSDVLVHSLELYDGRGYHVAENHDNGQYFVGTYYDKSQGKERIARFTVSNAAVQRGANIDGTNSAQGVSTFDSESMKSVHKFEKSGKEQLQTFSSTAYSNTLDLPSELKTTFIEYSHGWTTCVHPYYYDCNACPILANSLKNVARIWGHSSCQNEWNKGNNIAKGRWGQLGCATWWRNAKGSASPCTV